jgi:hypothetical protein
VDRASLREGGVVRVWIAAALVDETETLHEPDLPSCCQRSAHDAEDAFECPSCGATWREPEPAFSEEDAFMDGSRERRGAA